ncbi:MULTISPECIES: methionine aminotransferase [Olivibacter]|jgi:methionine aminotransferase|uniref:Kynurenine--oxoglutarate transaminase n=2 Tax=Sphingobacteriaceae TaxID=84566 RepID=F4C5K9_SPHS2|nr:MULTISPECIES: methionine aminotransferase [Olivibacter]MCL4639197.1 methionine aminotransferase [Olivibacter sp. UJ_SKK_5.1]MDM8175131.1 methionine aminotransferase [Olivibacter sp. 47]MDX3913188.1 methionine aminotransferase [Pseudosphingobacterium sp.]QEL01905.1 aminotransferase class I/II-fold pyridoxal phosphate-dependent enzyme [Olivibacter sp. LS-1]
MINVLSKLPNVSNSIFSTMTALANEHGAINLSQGFPDFDCSPKLIDLTQTYMKKGLNQYAPMPGVLQLREKIAEMVEKQQHAIYHPDKEITITAGATQAIFTAIASIIRPDDEVICFDPCYDSYAPAIDLCGGMVKTVSLLPNSFNINWDDVKKVFSHKTKLIIINTPHNPTSATLTDADMKQLIKLTQGTDIFIISDEVYDKVVFDGKKHISVASYPELRERSFVISSFGKMFHITGWKIGYCLAPEKLTVEFRKVHQYLVFSVNTPVQYALADFLMDESEYLLLSKFFQEKRDFFVNALRSTPFEILPASGSYFLLANYDKISDKGDLDFTKELTVNYGVATIPLSVFYKNRLDRHYIRFCFAKKHETLEKAVENLARIK